MASERMPSLVAFKGPNNKYLGYCKHEKYRGHLKFCYDDLTSPFVKHEIVEASNGHAHIKCCYYNRYWRSLEDLCWIVAGENSLDSDMSSQCCTLFDLKYEDKTSNTVSLRLLLQNNYVVYKELDQDTEREGCPFAGEDKLDKNGSFTLYDVGSLVRLPKFVAFKGFNGKFLARRDNFYLQFNSDDLGNNSIRHQVDEIGNGDVRVMHLESGITWWVNYLGQTFLWVQLTGDTDSPNVDFRPIQINAQTVAMRSLSSTRFCRSQSSDGFIDALNASADSLEATTHLTLVETVFSRRVHSIVYDLDTAHVYDLEPISLARGVATNTTNQPSTFELSLEYTERKTTRWSNSNSFKLGVSGTFTAGIPFIAKTTVEVSAEDTFTWEWGEEEERSTTISTNYAVLVDPGQSVEVILQATRAKCDVKFSYEQQDLLTTGETNTIHSEDGVFLGMNYTDIKYTHNILPVAGV